MIIVKNGVGVFPIEVGNDCEISVQLDPSFWVHFADDISEDTEGYIEFRHAE